MVESFLAVPLHFTVEFLGFLVFAGGAFLVISRPGLIAGEASNRVAVAMGFVLLAAGQVAHGGSFSSFEFDGAQILLGVRTAGLVFVLIGVLGGLRVGAGAIVIGGWRVQEPLFFAPAGAALLVAIVALRGSRAGGPRSMARLAIASFLLAVSEVVNAAAAEIVIGAGVVSAPAYFAHGVKALAFLALGAWFWTAVRSSIRVRFVASFAALLVGVVLALAVALTSVISANVQRAELKDVGVQARGVILDLEEETTNLKRNVSNIALFLSNEVATGQRLKPQVDQFRGVFQFDFIMVMEPDGQILAFSGRGPTIRQRGRNVETGIGPLERLEINEAPVIDTVLEGKSVAAAPTRVLDQTIATMAANEINSPAQPGRRIGVVAAGNYVDALSLERISARIGPEASLVVGGRTVASELPGKVPAQGLIPTEVRLQVDDGATVTRQTVFGNRSYGSVFKPILGGNRRPIATLILSTPAQRVVDARQGATSVLFVVAMGVGAIALLLAWLSGRRITRPIQVLTQTAEAVREGNLQIQAPVAGEDEVGRLGETFNEMTASLLNMTDDLRDAAREEHRLRSRIETIMQSMADGLVAVGADRHVLAFNREAENLTGISAADAMGRPIQEVLTAKDSQGTVIKLPIYELVAGAADNVFLEQPDGHAIPVAVVSAPLTGEDGEAAGGVLVMRDMTREREVERMKTEFLSNISHELRTPLTPIKGYAEILGRKDIPPDKVQKFVAGILESTTRLERIVQLLVDFSAMEAGRMAPRSTTVDLSSMVEELAIEWSKRSDRHAVVTEIGTEVPNVVGDELLLRRSIEEVFDNALKFSPYGGTITVEVKGASANGSAGGRQVEISISDEGIGIPSEDIPRIFSDFHQLDGSETRTYGGLGLGLAFVQRIIHAHDGSVTVVSEPQKGTRLTIAIPAAAGAN